eukprot:TRINITY_DN6154_c1_g1_i1.p1 TRINITY_DN6154_c1_g1~~TRINITY_DN6154_c1_g1_i1.p1  ORF type:complete len:522 (-),score=74.76 TRINITY_DN6154_c1_g1_i1:235-1800(-)
MADALESAPSWFTPFRMLLIFCTINMLNYIDRGAIASNGVNGLAGDVDCIASGAKSCSTGSGIQGEFNLSNFEDGLLPAAFMVGLLAASPFFATAAKHASPFRLIGIGLSVWTLALIGCGFSTGLVTLLVCRMFVGVGEASFISLAAPFIDDHAPKGSTARWLSAFYMCIPTGYALGYIYGAAVPMLFGTWRGAFWAEGACMFPIAVFALVSKPIPLSGGPPGGFKRSSSGEEPTKPRSGALPGTGAAATSAGGVVTKGGVSFAVFSQGMITDVKTLLGNPTFAINVAGYTAYTFVIGAYAFWGPKAALVLFNMADADTVFGGVTVLSGIGGTVFGGVMLDYLGGTIPRAFQLMGTVTFIGGVFCLGAFLAPSTAVFIPLLVLGEFFVFAIQGPANIVSMQSVPPSLRALSIALSTVVTHLLGDVPSPPILGALQDATGNWRISMGVFTAIFLPAAALWASGTFVSRRGRGAAPDSSTSSLLQSKDDLEEGGTAGQLPISNFVPDDQQRSRLLPEGATSNV